MVGKHIFVSGRVQGVGYRYFAKIQADMLGLKGWVRNLISGKVEIKVAGPETIVENYLLKLKSGPPRSKVDDLDARDIEISQVNSHNEFEILPDGSE